MTRACEVPLCDGTVRKGPWCGAHRARYYRHGDVLAHIPVRRSGRTVEARFRERVRKTDGCWVWTGQVQPNGYGRFAVTAAYGPSAHRFAYELLVGPIPAGLQVDHVCHTAALRAGTCSGGSSCLHRRCVNPAHLELVTAGENTRRWAAAKTRCKHGHLLTTENTYRPPGAPHRRQCRACRSETKRRTRRRRRDAQTRT